MINRIKQRAMYYINHKLRTLDKVAFKFSKSRFSKEIHKKFRMQIKDKICYLKSRSKMETLKMD